MSLLLSNLSKSVSGPDLVDCSGSCLLLRLHAFGLAFMGYTSQGEKQQYNMTKGGRSAGAELRDVLCFQVFAFPFCCWGPWLWVLCVLRWLEACSSE